MTFSLTSLILDAADLESESSFWHRLLGGSITRTATHHFLRIDGFPVIVIQHAPGHLSPQWPDGAAQQMHFDLATDDPVSADKRVLDAGGRRLRPSGDVNTSPRQGSLVYASPAGHPFCLRPV
ncbi:VOC family protein [Actinomadura montaniterrae]|uniref:VOC family protein n=1 Tax=Actinomadura montaniterrae TaxID=1803903 RepID=A0A6L3VYJ8_9ACTN|nr:VOC family protein [Actinomadura montaniterrae]KAB2382927.1 VOC family protein [Actinomadura montaniterrae]